MRQCAAQVEKLPSGYIPGLDSCLDFLQHWLAARIPGWGPDDLYYPEWMEGRALAAAQRPLGLEWELLHAANRLPDKMLSASR